MATWLVLSLISMALVGTADLLVRRATLLGVRPASFMVVQSWFFGPAALLWGLATARLAWSRAALLSVSSPACWRPWRRTRSCAACRPRGAR